MDTHSLKIFVEVMERGSFAAVARDRDLDPSSISRTISSLEESVGVRLFQRTTRRLSPTEAGALFYDRISHLVNELEEACNKAQDIASEPKGALRVTASIAFGNNILAPLLARFRNHYPSLKIDLVLTDVNIDLISERIDVAIRLGAPKDSGLIATKLFDIYYRVCVSPAYLETNGPITEPLQLPEKDCPRLPFTGHKTSWRFRDKKGTEQQVPVNGSIIISSPLALHRAALDGCGPCLLPNFLADNDIEKGKLIDLFPEYDITPTEFNTAAWMMYTSKSYLPSKTRAFIDFLKENTVQFR